MNQSKTESKILRNLLTKTTNFLILILGWILFWKNPNSSDYAYSDEEWNDPFLSGKESRILFFIFYWISLGVDHLMGRKNRLHQEAKNKRFLMFRRNRIVMYKNRYVGDSGLIPITNLRSMATPRKLLKKIIKYGLVFMVLRFLFG